MLLGCCIAYQNSFTNKPILAGKRDGVFVGASDQPENVSAVLSEHKHHRGRCIVGGGQCAPHEHRPLVIRHCKGLVDIRFAPHVDLLGLRIVGRRPVPNVESGRVGSNRNHIAVEFVVKQTFRRDIRVRRKNILAVHRIHCREGHKFLPRLVLKHHRCAVVQRDAVNFKALN